MGEIKKLGIIGGSGLEKSDILENIEEVEVETPYGNVKLKKSSLHNIEIYLLSRHGENHEITPSRVNNQANIFALAKIGCKHVLATTAVGSLRDNIEPGDFVIVNQFMDFTKNRKTTFFEDFKQGVKHISMADPFSSFLRDYLIDTCTELNLKHHKIGTVLTIEGPRFSTRAESFFFKKHAHVINMSTAPEAILAREANLEYAVIAMSTDYDCWKKTEEPVTWGQVKKVMEKNAERVKELLTRTIEKIANREIINNEIETIKKKIRTIPNFPKQGVMFRDITTLIRDPEGFEKVLNILERRYKDKEIDLIAGIESRGFVIAAALASRLNKGLVLIRKPGKLPGETESIEYELEYGTDKIEIHKDAVKPGQKVLLIDDLIATGGTAQAAASLIEKIGGEVAECSFVIELPDLRGSEKLVKWPFFSIVEFGGE